MRCVRLLASPAMVFLAVLLPAVLQAQPASLEGTALDSVTGAPVAGARVVLQGRLEYHSLTDSQGRFAIQGAAPGKYKLSASKSDYAQMVFGGRRNNLDDEGEPVPLAAGERRSDVELRMIPAAVIAGRVVDKLGEPVPGLFVAAGRIGYEGRRRKMDGAPYSLIVTNDRGEYRLYGLPPGKYYLMVAGLIDFFSFDFFGHGSGADSVGMGDAPPKETRGTQYYPGVADPAQATALELRVGEEKACVDFRFDYTPLVSVRGHVAVPAFCHGQLTFQAEREIATDQKYPLQFASTPDGSFELRGISPGIWRISAFANDQKTSCSTETATVQVGASGADGVALALQPSVGLAGVVRMEGESGFRFQDALVRFESFEDGGQGSAQIKADGRFTSTLEPRHWSLTVTGVPRNAFTKSARLGGTDVLESGLNLTAGPPVGGLEIVLSTAGAQVEGAVFDGSERPARGATVVLAPEPRLRLHGRLFQEASTDKDGRFAFRGIAPGEYKLFAWNEVEGEAYRDPDFLRDYEARGEKIVVRENEAKQRRLKLIVR
jgi:protocatechuate 3,4-dioxygenase beta subunit